MSSWKKYSGHCAICGVWRSGLHKDHIVAKWRGGSDDPSNIQRVCANCHEDKTKVEQETDEYREMMSLKTSGRVLTDEHRRRISAGNKGKKLTDEHRRHLSLARNGLRLSEESKAKRNLAMKRPPRVVIAYACGCGNELVTPDRKCRPIRFINGHGPGLVAARAELATTRAAQRYSLKGL